MLPSPRAANQIANALDNAIIGLSEFKDELDHHPDPDRDAAFALADPSHPDFEKLIELLSRWSTRLREVGDGR